MKLRKRKQRELEAKIEVAKLIRTHHDNLDSIYDQCEDAAKGLSMDAVPLKTLRVVIDLVKDGR